MLASFQFKHLDELQAGGRGESPWLALGQNEWETSRPLEVGGLELRDLGPWRITCTDLGRRGAGQGRQLEPGRIASGQVEENKPADNCF